MSGALVDRLFSRFAALYGAQKVGAMWHGADIAEVKSVWAAQIEPHKDVLRDAVQVFKCYGQLNQMCNL